MKVDDSSPRGTSASAISGIRTRPETTLRVGGVGDCWNMTWGPDGRQLAALCDGFSWPGMPQGYWSSRMFAIAGSPPDIRFEHLPGYPDLPCTRGTDYYDHAYYGFGTLAVDGRIYQFLSSRNTAEEYRFTGAKLVYSDDGGTTWHNQDGSSPVVWETWHERSAQNMTFFREPGEAFSMPTILQMGQDYGDNRDGYGYVYSPNGNAVDTMSQLVLCRVPRGELLDRASYRFFAGREPDGSAIWSPDVESRQPVCEFPPGWVLPIAEDMSTQPHSWHPSVVYDAPLGVYVMAAFGMGLGHGAETRDDADHGRGDRNTYWFGKPSYLGVWVADEPWGPWLQVHEDAAWTPTGDDAERVYEVVISPKWISDDGRSLWLVWTDFQDTGRRSEQEFVADLTALVEAGRYEDARALHLEQMPYYGFNAQRVDLLLEGDPRRRR